MEIYVVQQGDTVASIAQKYGISPERLITDNGIIAPYSLAVGQTLVITKPSAVYTVKEGDTLEGIAKAHDVTVMQLLRNNPWLAEREYIYPDETIVISYDNNMGNLLVTGYCYPYISDVTLRMTLPYLTYLVVFNYRMTREGTLVGSDDDIAVVETAKAYGVGSTLVVTTFSLTGEEDPAAAYEILRNTSLQKKLIDNLLSIVKEKGLCGSQSGFSIYQCIKPAILLRFSDKCS
jgi:spore germination protein